MKTGNIWEDFEWPVASEYTWRETPLGLALAAAPGAKTSRRYRPLARESAGLFREFADLDPTPAAALDFARRYGSLGSPVQRVIGANGQSWRIDPTAFAPTGIGAAGLAVWADAENLVEPFDCEPDPGLVDGCWKSQITLMADFLRWLRDGSASEIELDSQVDTPLMRDAIAEMGAMGRGLQVNAILAATAAPRLTPTGRGRSFRFRLEPRSLLGALWLQAAQAAAEGMTFRHCAACRKPIAIARTTGARSDAKFCSDACKSRSYRRRQARAVALSGRGWTPGRIAKELHTTTATVRRWTK